MIEAAGWFARGPGHAPQQDRAKERVVRRPAAGAIEKGRLHRWTVSTIMANRLSCRRLVPDACYGTVGEAGFGAAAACGAGSGGSLAE